MIEIKNKVRKDFESVNIFIKSIEYSDLISDDVELYLKKIHKIAYSICKWKVFLDEKYHDYSIDEIFSDFIEIIYIVPLKDIKILMFLIRNIIDNFRRLIKNTIGISGNDFDAFINNMNSKSEGKEYKKSIATVSRLYKETSNYIHSTFENKCSLIDGIKNFEVKDKSKIEKIIDDICELGKSINFIFVLVYTDIFTKDFGRYNREIILNGLDKTRIKIIKKLLY